MTLPLVYLDQNIISLQLAGKIDLSGLTGMQWVYSKEHFAEISRSQNPVPFLQTLDSLSAKLIDLEIVNWEFTGEARLNEEINAERHYERYSDAIKTVPSIDTLFHPFHVWICGGDSEDALRSIPEKLAHHLKALADSLPDSTVLEGFYHFQSEFKQMIDAMIRSGNDIEEFRHQLGVGNGAAGSIKGDNPLGQLWEKVSPKMPGITSDEYFGFSSLPNEQQQPLTWFGIIKCCAILDVLGYAAEGKKTRNLDKIANVISDANHIATSAYCQAMISRDNRLVDRARAIYQFRNIGTQAIFLDLTPES
ncbi:MAG: hypothetical protein JXQ97_03955 [Natronospirillum sp.]